MTKADKRENLREKLLGEREVPASFYKYTPIEAWLPDLLAGRSLKFSSRTGFNDPFDSRPACRIEIDTPHGDAFIKEEIAKMELSPARRLLYTQQIRNQSRQPRQIIDGATEELLDDTGILSLATDWRNHLLWSHYGKHHQGMCVEFSPAVDVFRVALPVTYVKELPVILRPSDTPDELLRKAMFTKAQCWEYEDEWRVIKRSMSEKERALTRQRDEAAGMSPEEVRILSNHRGVGIYSFDQSAIKSITLGMNAEGSATAVLRAVRESQLDIPVYIVNKPSASYDLTRRLLKRSRK